MPRTVASPPLGPGTSLANSCASCGVLAPLKRAAEQQGPLRKCVLVGASVGFLEACLQQLSAELALAKHLLGL